MAEIERSVVAILQQLREVANRSASRVDEARGAHMMARAAGVSRFDLRDVISEPDFFKAPPTVKQAAQTLANRLTGLRGVAAAAAAGDADERDMRDAAAGAVDAAVRLVREVNTLLRPPTKTRAAKSSAVSTDDVRAALRGVQMRGKTMRAKGRPGFVPNPDIVNETAAPRGYAFTAQWLFAVNRSLGVLQYAKGANEIAHRIRRGFMKPGDLFFIAKTNREEQRVFARTFAQLEKFGFMTNDERLLARRAINLWPPVTDAIGRAHRALAAGDMSGAVAAASDYAAAINGLFPVLRRIQEIAYSRPGAKSVKATKKLPTGKLIINNVRSAFQNLSRVRPDLDTVSGDLEWASWALGRMIDLLKRNRVTPGLMDLVRAQGMIDMVRRDIEGDNDGIPVNPMPLKNALDLIEPILTRAVSLETSGTTFAKLPAVRSRKGRPNEMPGAPQLGVIRARNAARRLANISRFRDPSTGELNGTVLAELVKACDDIWRFGSSISGNQLVGPHGIRLEKASGDLKTELDTLRSLQGVSARGPKARDHYRHFVQRVEDYARECIALMNEAEALGFGSASKQFSYNPAADGEAGGRRDRAFFAAVGKAKRALTAAYDLYRRGDYNKGFTAFEAAYNQFADLPRTLRRMGLDADAKKAAQISRLISAQFEEISSRASNEMVMSRGPEQTKWMADQLYAIIARMPPGDEL